MKKLKLSALTMSGVEILTREQLKRVNGGYIPTTTRLYSTPEDRPMTTEEGCNAGTCTSSSDCGEGCGCYEDCPGTPSYCMRES